MSTTLEKLTEMKDCMQRMMDEVDRAIVIARRSDQTPSLEISQDEPLGI